ncbi:MAG: hypothetical protein F4Y47_17145 [Acidobacteriia bacterium]|nr:hypothetical protein [Terriglobia bacterium]MYG02749.1 hypothetical protein [Terriglobia bacterium]MYK12382.1 hypothetical protein [Terriglobia bacterium]
MGDGQQLKEFGRLTDASLRAAWPHEAHDFTPWLAENLERLSEAIGIPLEAESSEVRVGKFAADILASGPEGQSVLIENQLESSDHSHFGQIMTYLAGLDARVVVWIARDFTDPHISAIQWLNRHTDDEFAFFAVKLRVVTIADSPLAPIFEVIAKPNNWERQVRRESSGSRAENITNYREFWTHYARRYPNDGVSANHGHSNFWIRPRKDAPAVSLAFSYAGGQVGIFFAPRGLSDEEMNQWLSKRRLDRHGHWKSFDTSNRGNWDAICNWLHNKLGQYLTMVEADPEESK